MPSEKVAELLARLSPADVAALRQAVGLPTTRPAKPKREELDGPVVVMRTVATEHPQRRIEIDPDYANLYYCADCHRFLPPYQAYEHGEVGHTHHDYFFLWQDWVEVKDVRMQDAKREQVGHVPHSLAVQKIMEELQQ
jgi:hypothetical protein